MKKIFKNKSLAISLGSVFLIFVILGIDYFTADKNFRGHFNYNSEETFFGKLPTVPKIHANIDVEWNFNSDALTEIKNISTEKKLDKGLKLYRKGKYQKAIDIFSEILAENPNNEIAYNRRGNVYLKLEQYDAAITDYNRAIALNPNYLKAYNNRGNAYFKLQLYESALADYNRVIELNPNLEFARYNRGNIFAKLGNYDAAISDYNRALQINPNFAEVYHNRGICYKNLGENKKARADFKKAEQLGYKN